MDSVCPRCHVTVVTSSSEAILERAEMAHACATARVRAMDKTRRPSLKAA